MHRSPLDNPGVTDPVELTPKTFELGPKPFEFVRIEKMRTTPKPLTVYAVVRWSMWFLDEYVLSMF